MAGTIWREVIIDGTHTNIVKMVQDGTVLLDRTGTAQGAGSKGKGDRTWMTFQGLIEYARTVDLEAVKALSETQMTYNTAISDEGLTGAWGAEVGRTLLETYGSDVKFRAVLGRLPAVMPHERLPETRRD